MTSQTIQKRSPNIIVRSLITFAVAGVIGFLVLFIGTLFWWCTLGFKEALVRVERLSYQETTWVRALSPVTVRRVFWWSDSIEQAWKPFISRTQKTAHQLQEALDLPLQALEEALLETNFPAIAGMGPTLMTFFAHTYRLGGACLQVLWLKILLCLSALPLFILMSLAGLIDGLNQRAIRTASLGRESTYVFHKSLPLARKTLFWVLVVWLSLPFDFNPTGLFVGLSVLLALVMSTSASRFKKYL
ncbi:Fe2+/Zn2+ uptake regulation protein [Legionella busanensis]|uniref:Fe2+/Zn2+ uptake regulation protein n=1 Tax=Legionella busanensis TaxID=190655 RepID=A0A378KIE8_9GAMM|nr:DUF4400 domain-containing protein [Legionella busanensis]STX81564.1 Fe2+/Zn2+ uptake regulation protein [Legionella busanensis]